MNEVKKCSISGVAFTLDCAAYEELNNYLTSLNDSYADNPDGKEIIADIEARIAELILSTQDNTRVVELPLVRNIIEQLGTAEDIHEGSEEKPHAKTHSHTERFPKRLYRNMSGAKLGGVCSGLSTYFNIDVAYIRLALFALPVLGIFFDIIDVHILSRMFLQTFPLTLLLYVIMWFVVPAARTARQKLEMEGQPITTRSVASMTSETDIDSTAKPLIAETVSFLGRITLALLKLFAGFIIFLLVLTLFTVVTGFVTILTSGTFFATPITCSPLVAVLGTLAAFLPIVMLLYVIGAWLLSRRSSGKVTLSLFLLWVVNIGALIFFGVRDMDNCNFSSFGNVNTKLQWLDDRQKSDEEILRELEAQFEDCESIEYTVTKDSKGNTHAEVKAKSK